MHQRTSSGGVAVSSGAGMRGEPQSVRDAYDKQQAKNCKK